MRLPDYSGPFSVGAIDLEIPVREPQSFGAQYVANDTINRPRKPHAEATKAHEAAEQRVEEGGSDVDVNENLQQGGLENGVCGQDEKNSVWSPTSGGAQTSTLHFSTVLFTVFYPSSVKSEQRKKYSELAWIGRPKRKGFSAFLQYIGQYGAFAAPAAPAVLSLLNARVPALAGAPLADPNENVLRAPPPLDKVETGNFGNEPANFPVMIFSHGLAGNRLSYSQFCGELASQGIVVAAIEHRDGSGIASMVRAPVSDSSREHSVKLKVPYFSFETVGLRSFAEDPSEQEAGLRQAQLAMRGAEIRECLHVLQQIADGKGEEVAKSSTRGLTSKLSQHKPARKKQRVKQAHEEALRLQKWQGKLDMEFPAVCGHSFGGATVIELQRGRAGSTKDHEKLYGSEEVRQENTSKSPFPYAIILDPWVEPIQWRSEKDDQPDTRPIQGAAYVINSETFTVWRNHFSKLKRILHDSQKTERGERGWLMTLCGCQHLDFSDLPILLPHVFRSTVGPRTTVTIFSRAAYAQMGLARQRHRDSTDKPGVKTSAMFPEDMSKKDRSRQNQKGIKQHIRAGVDTHLSSKIDEPMDESVIGSSVQDGDAQNEHTRQAPLSKEVDGEEDANVEEPKSDDKQWTTTAEDSPLRSAAGHDRINKMDDLREKKSKATDRLWIAKKERQERERKRKILMERKQRGLVATVAERTADGDFKGQPLEGGLNTREDEENILATIDFSDRADDIEADEDASAVQSNLQELVKRLDYKQVKIHSLMGFLFHVKGLQPGLDQPGKVLVHQY